MAEDDFTDRRIVRTNRAIRKAMVELIEEKGVDALTVRDIVKRADINRGTFYLHYRDKYDLLEQTQAEVIWDLEKIVKQASTLNLPELSADKPLPLVVNIFEYIRDNAPLMRVILKLKGEFDFQARLRKTVEKNLKIGFLPIMKSVVTLVSEEYLITYVISAHLGVVKSWLYNGCAESPYEIASILSRLSIDGPFHALQFTEANKP
jgi:AcrR family transcriptional regulator